jgi:ribonuclease BN (tRNA processing enzyme)
MELSCKTALTFCIDRNSKTLTRKHEISRMLLTFLGAGAAFSLDNYQSNLIIEASGQRLLIDAGGDIRFSLQAAGYSYKDIHSVYVTHIHNDHVGGMEFLAFTRYFDPSCPKPHLYCHKWLVEDLWATTLRGGLASIQGKILRMEDYFTIHALNNYESFVWQDVRFEMVQSFHIYNGYWVVPTFGLLMHDPATNMTIYHTSDTQLKLEYVHPSYQRANLIIQDCETSTFKTGVHAHYDELVRLDPQVKAKMYLWHYQDNVSQNFSTWQARAKQDGFAGFLYKGQVMRINP